MHAGLTLGSIVTLASLCTGAAQTPATVQTPPAAQAPAAAQAELEAVAAEVQADIEKLRGVKFAKPVPVKIADKAALLAYFDERVKLDTTPGRDEFEEELLQLLGLVPRDMDLAAVTRAFYAAQVGGFYDPPTKTFQIVDSFNAQLGRVIMAHEFVHALDDQLYDLDGTARRLRDDSDALLAFQAVCEGSAMYTMTAWQMTHMASLDPKVLAELMELTNSSTDGVPAVVWKPALAAYMSGQAFLAAGVAKPKHARGTEAPPRPDYALQLARAFTSPPASSEQVLHPEKYWDETQRDAPRVLAFDRTRVPAGWRVLGEDTLGELRIALLATPLAERGGADMQDAAALAALRYTNDAAAGWGGDRLVVLANGDARLLQLVTVWDTEADAGEFERAIGAVWAAEPADKGVSGRRVLASDRVAGPKDGAPVHSVTLTISSRAGGEADPAPLPWSVTR